MQMNIIKRTKIRSTCCQKRQHVVATYVGLVAFDILCQKKTWREIVEKDCQARKLNREDAMDRTKWMKQIRDD